MILRPPSPRRPLRPAWAAALALLIAGCAGEPARRDGAAATTEAATIPRPNLEAMEAGARDRVLAAIAAIEELDGAGDAERAAAYGALGDLYFAYHLLDAADVCYRQAARLDPLQPRWPALRGMALQAAGSLREAEASLERALELAPADLPLHLRLGDLLLEAGRLAPAEASYRRALAIDPASAAAHHGLGRVAAESDRPREAIEHYERALALAPEATALHYPLGQLYRRVGDVDAARRHLAARGDRGIGLDDPRLRDIHGLKIRTAFDNVRQLAADAERLSEDDLLGYAIVQFGDVASAVREFERVLGEQETTLEPRERARARYVLGALEARAGDHRAAIESYRTARSLDPSFFAARVQLGWSLTRIGETEAGLREIDAVLAERPDDPRALLKRAAVFAEGGQRRRARADLERLLSLEPRHGEALLRLASLDEDEGNLEAARLRYAAALDLAMPAEDRALVHYRLGDLASRRGAPAEAADHYRAALRLDGELDQARMRLAASLSASGDGEGAAAALAELVERHPGDPTAVVTLAGTLIGLGRHRAALAALEDGQRASGGDDRIAALLARHLAASPDPRVRDGERALAIVGELLARRQTLEDAETLAMALAAAGRFESAAARQGELIAFARRQERHADLPRLERNLDRYRSGQPCCAGP
ncbi:MAG TPA: tetratricopeptide repeat protein [Thermoanaerobaculia bacterium]